MFLPREQPVELELPQEKNLEHAPAGKLEPREVDRLAQQLRVQSLGLVDDHEDLAVGGEGLEQEMPQPDIKRFPALEAALEAELDGQEIEKIERREIGVMNRDEDRRHLVQTDEMADEGRLAGADVAGHHHRAVALEDPLLERRKRIGVLLAQPKEGGVRLDAEGISCQPVASSVHRKHPSLTVWASES